MPEPNPEEKEKKVLVEYLPQPSTETKSDEVLETHLELLDGSHTCLFEGWVLPADKKEARRILYRAANYTMIDGMLYK